MERKILRPSDDLLHSSVQMFAFGRKVCFSFPTLILNKIKNQTVKIAHSS